MEVQSENVPTCQCGDGCATNIKAAYLVSKAIGLKAPFTRCGSHASAGTMKRLCTSQTMCNDDAKALYENLRKLLKHFSQSPKSTDLLNKAPHALEMNNTHLLNWGSTRMAGFIDACVHSSKIIVPLLDTIITRQTAYIGSAKGVYQLQLFADLHTLFGNAYLHRVDSDGEKILSCEAYNIAKRTALQLGCVQTPLADDLLESLKEDENRNLVVSFQLKHENHALRLN